MELYTLLREFADSWMMLALFAVFIIVVFWAFRPGSRKAHDEAANSIFRHDKKPAAADEVRQRRTASGSQSEEA